MDTTFPASFLWGASTAAYQIEGAYTADGKGESIWDKFSHTPGKVAHGDTGDVACDHYHLYREDVGLLADLGVAAYRFSTAWTRIFPEGRGKPNPKGIDFYERLIDALLDNKIQPWLCCYHWDLPQALQAKGGWTNRDTVYYFADYAAYLAERLGDRVTHFALFNEPNIAALLGHLLGIHAPGHTDLSEYLAVTHHYNLATGYTAERLRSMGDWQLGTVLNLQPVHPATDEDEDIVAAQTFAAFTNKSVLDPLFNGTYPAQLSMLLEPLIDANDMTQIQQPLDFLGVNYYTRMLVKADSSSLVGLAQADPPARAETTAMGWEIYPEGLYEQLLELKDSYAVPALFMTENGAAFHDIVTQDGVNDARRVAYLQSHLEQVARAIENGVNVQGYFVWSLLDNFEWSEGYDKRFGIVHVDYATQTRTPKASYHWYQAAISNGGF